MYRGSINGAAELSITFPPVVMNVNKCDARSAHSWRSLCVPVISSDMLTDIRGL
jgi:hypothetical protein